MNNRRFCFVTLVASMPLATTLLTGCAAKGPCHRLARVVDQSGVVDASARRVNGDWFLRFDALLLSDLDDAILAENVAEAADAEEVARMRTLATDVVRQARGLADRVRADEIARLPEASRRQLADELGSSANPLALRQAFRERADTAMAERMRDWETLTPAQLGRQLRHLRREVEPLPDDRGRSLRQIAFAWGAIPTWIGLNREERQAVPKTLDKLNHSFTRSATWLPNASVGEMESLDPLLARFAPTLVVEQASSPSYAPEYDRIGRVHLAGSPDLIQVEVDTDEPVLYAYRNEAKLNGKRYARLVYTWWFPERPAMIDDDPSSGHIDGGTLRITLDDDSRPAFCEVILNCGCEHRVFVASEIEKSAQRTFHKPLPGKRFAIERNVLNHFDVIVSDTFDLPPNTDRLAIHISAGYHEVCRILADETSDTSASGTPTSNAEESRTYALLPYDALVDLPIGESEGEGEHGSMFGPDGLVHRAGRPEGYLLAPTGMLSAGQPRQRGTQRIRWDAYLFDDPHLLERTLRLPPALSLTVHDTAHGEVATLGK